jgi:DTW domain-containing protein YfiP
MSIKFILLTHSRESLRTNNTGQLVTGLVGERAKVIVWDRVTPAPELLAMIASQEWQLLFPELKQDQLLHQKTNVAMSPELSPSLVHKESQIHGEQENILALQGYIILDATWQEARKMYNRSPYLHSLVKCQLTPARPSSYVMRRNQLAEGLCTAECVSELLHLHNEPALAQTLELALSEFQLLPRKVKI